ncbi:MAG TPA: ABC transporter ATP-binding protein, partial [Polyangia bacterium]|nr:ABC transporter ATP-binding protein [Polyangia bacterium]
LAEPLRLHRLTEGRAATAARVAELLGRVGLPAGAASKHPHEFSGGQRQRIAIARALAVEPELIVADEPVSSLDVNVQGQIINLLVDLQRRLGLTYLFIAHDLAVVRHISDRVVILYRGQVMETGRAEDVFERPLHPYTRLLLASVPDPRRPLAAPPAATPEASARLDLSRGCPFRARCPLAQAICEAERPPLRRHDNGSSVACHFA